MQGHLSSLRDRVLLHVRQAGATAGRWFGVVREPIVRYTGVTHRVLKRWTFQVLGPVETVLLNAASRERIHAAATFTLIFLFAVASVDFLIAGGPEFGVPARAERPQQATYAAPPAPARETTVLRANPDESAELAPALAAATDANVIALSQTFDLPANAPAQPVAADLSAPSGTHNASLAGDSPAETVAVAEPASPRKRARTKPAPEAAPDEA